jgi:hypothetical protein
MDHGFFRDRNGSVTTFDPPGSVVTVPYSISNGVITGYYGDRRLGRTVGFLLSR